MTRFQTFMFFSIFMMASFQSQSAHGSDWEVWEGRQERRLTHALAGMHFDDRAEERDLKAEELALERRKQALRERQYRDAQKEKERAHQKARAKAEQARALEKRKERNEQALAFLRPWYSQCQSGSKRADALLREGTAAAVSANEEGKLLSEELVGRLLERRARADEAMAYVREDLNKGTFSHNKEYEAQLRNRLKRGYEGFSLDFVETTLAAKRKKEKLHEYEWGDF